MTYSITALCGNGITAVKMARKMRLSCYKEEFSPYVKGVFNLSLDWDDDKYHHLLQGIQVFPESCGNFNYCRKITSFLDDEYYLYFCGEVSNQLVWEYIEFEEEKTLNLLGEWAKTNEETDKIIHCINYSRGQNQILRNVHSSLNPLVPIRLI
ncbi:hypothetical protein [Laspinema olomoucense]|uniref:Uncharacterized protein n=1 Tax=Laspinema olomoucense D3b TaxID=2953688 RepID=A0ABT2N4M7_9CYAN|nr:hypothetical protein [Laspinema sp. D3b]MCT7977644.1 hypothetical protein [Laspinema sp. D3b]